jgi:hypothetical protein
MFFSSPQSSQINAKLLFCPHHQRKPRKVADGDEQMGVFAKMNE